MDPSLIVAVGIAASALVSELLLAWYFKGWAEDELEAGRTALQATVEGIVKDVRTQVDARTAEVTATLGELPKALASVGPTIVEGLAPFVTDALVSRGAAAMADKSNAAQALAKAGLGDLDLGKLAADPDVQKVLANLQGGGAAANPTMSLLKRLVPKQYHPLLAGMELKSAMGGRAGGYSGNSSKGWWEY